MTNLEITITKLTNELDWGEIEKGDWAFSLKDYKRIANLKDAVVNDITALAIAYSNSEEYHSTNAWPSLSADQVEIRARKMADSSVLCSDEGEWE